jgi:16S rRNA processing protein RimM
MEYLSVGKIMEPFALKGEVKIASDFKYSSEVFKVGNTIYLGEDKRTLKISKSRFYKNRYYVLFEGYNDINEISSFLKKIVYFKREDLNTNGSYLKSDIVGFNVIEDGVTIGILDDVIDMNGREIYRVKSDNNYFMIPNNSEFIKGIDALNKRITVKLIEGMR